MEQYTGDYLHKSCPSCGKEWIGYKNDLACPQCMKAIEDAFPTTQATPSPAKAEQEGQWYKIEETERGNGEWKLTPNDQSYPGWKPGKIELQPIHDRKFYIWIPVSTTSPVKEAGQPVGDFMSFLSQHSEAGITGKITKKELKEMERVNEQPGQQPAPSGLRLPEDVTCFLRDVATIYNHDIDAEKYNIKCRMCEAQKLRNKYDSDSPAPVQVDPVKFAEWVSQEGFHYWPEENAWDGPGEFKSGPRHASTELLNLYTQSLQNKP